MNSLAYTKLHNNYVLTPEEMQEVDRIAITETSLSAYSLMENAGKAVYNILKEELSYEDHICVIAGTGNNGGDGFVLSYFLFKNNYDITLILLSDIKKLKRDAKLHFRRLLKAGFKNYKIMTPVKPIDFSNFTYLVDAILGTGFSGHIEGFYHKIISKMNESNAQILSVDIPSGLNGRNGMLATIAVHASKTVTIGALKHGLIMNHSFSHCGSINIVDIGFPEFAFKQIKETYHLNTIHTIKNYLPKRPVNAHKTNFGKILVVGGSKLMSGAVSLTAKASLYSGSGLVKVATPLSAFRSVDILVPEAMVIPISENSDGTISATAFNELENEIAWADVVVCGMGMGNRKSVRAFIQNILHNTKKPTVIDADGINALSRADLKKYDFSNVVLTPHIGEFSHLMDISKEEIITDVFTGLKKFMKDCNGNLILKGKPSYIVNRNNQRINLTGNSGMATAGSGDVLSGIIASFIGQGMPPFEASELATFCHGLAGDFVKSKKTEYSLIASDLVKYLPKVFKKLLSLV